MINIDEVGALETRWQTLSEPQYWAGLSSVCLVTPSLALLLGANDWIL